MTVFRQYLQASDTIAEDETESPQSYVPANTPMGFRAVTTIDRAQRNGSRATFPRIQTTRVHKTVY